MKIWPGHPFPLGATYDGAGTNFSIFSDVAQRVDLCLFTDDGSETLRTLPEVTAHIHHGYLPGCQPGQRYGFRVHAPWDLDHGHRGNPAKLLVDPYAKAVEGEVEWCEAVLPYDPAAPERPDERDNARFVPKSVVTNPYFDWGDDRHPRTPWHRTVVYEAHVKGLTERHPAIHPDLRGTYLGVAEPVIIEHLLGLGVTAIELMPVHQFITDKPLWERGLTNYWGYQSLAYLAPHNGYSAFGQLGQQTQEFKQMVRSLHQAGIEVILDVVYNHTGEGDHTGPALCLRGADNAAYYRLDPSNRRHYVDYTGTGNSLNMRHPHVLQLIMDSLRYWVLEMHVDGFRFDLAATLARELHDVDRLSSFFDIVQQDPVISQAKLIAEPWDVGEGGYQVGNFPPLWSEWNGRYRDEVRDFWRGAEHTVKEFGYRFTGSSDLYEDDGRTPSASINFVTCHDGFTLHDLVSYDHKHNEANGEANADGTPDNRSWNCGVEGPTDDVAVNSLRRRQRRNLLTTLFLSQGVPMLLAGDELGRTQLGNNNAYVQDNEISWVDWEGRDADLLEFTRRLSGLRASHAVFRRRKWFQGQPIAGELTEDIGWFTLGAERMTQHDWDASFARSIAVFLNGDGILATGPRGETVLDDSFYAMFNAHDGDLPFTLPGADYGDTWVLALDTAHDDPDAAVPVTPVGRRPTIAAGAVVTVQARSIQVLQRSAPGR